ncbi:MAG: hypothetical protein WCD02_01230 [Terriglobales bacterium]
MFVSDDVVFAWAIEKAFLIVIVALGILVYAAWAVTWQRPRKLLRMEMAGRRESHEPR